MRRLRATFPKVPTLVRRLRAAIPQVPTLVRRLRATFPKVPTLARRLRATFPKVPTLVRRLRAAFRRGRSSASKMEPHRPLPEFTITEGYQIELWAENPLLEKPTQMNWDAQGRLWVTSSSLYPMIAPGQDADDKVLILEDTDHDGKADQSTVFAHGLLVPTGVEPDLQPGASSAPAGAGASGDGETPGFTRG